MDNPIKVAVVRTDRRRWRSCGGPRPHRRRLAASACRTILTRSSSRTSTILSVPGRVPIATPSRATADALLAAGASSITILGEPADGARIPRVPVIGLAIARSSGTGRPGSATLEADTDDESWSTIPWDATGTGQVRSLRVPAWLAGLAVPRDPRRRQDP